MTNAISKKYEHRVHLLLISRSLETALGNAANLLI